MNNENVFARWKNRVWDYNLSLIDGYKRLLSHRKYAILLDLSLAIQAYDFGVRMQARTDFKRDVFSSYAEEGYIDDEKKVTTKVKNSFQSSFENKRSDKIRNLVLETELMHTFSEVEPLKHDQGEEPLLRKKITLNDDLEEAFLPTFFGSSRGEISKSLKGKLQLSDDMISRIQSLAFDEVVSLANRKYDSGFLPKNIANLIGFLERSVEIYFPLLLNDLKWNGKVFSLLELRNSSRQNFNTACHRCGKQLFKKDNKHYCTRSENRSCYEARFKENRDSGFPMAILRTKNKCDRCGKQSSLNYIHKLGGQQMQFCSNRCWEDYRKMKYRMKKKT